MITEYGVDDEWCEFCYKTLPMLLLIFFVAMRSFLNNVDPFYKFAYEQKFVEEQVRKKELCKNQFLLNVGPFNK